MARLKEQRAWDSFRSDHPSGRLKLERVENQVSDHMADVIGQNRLGATFWLEFKAVDAWPKRPTTPVMADLFEPGQLPWLRSWCQWGGHAYVVLRIGEDKLFYVFDPLDDELLVHGKADLIRSALVGGKYNIYDWLDRLRPLI